MEWKLPCAASFLLPVHPSKGLLLKDENDASCWPLSLSLSKRFMAGDVLTEDLVVEVLLRLPVKSLLRFRCVCKAWFFHITSPTFIAAHIGHHNKQNKSLLLVRKYNDLESKVMYTITQDNDRLDEIMKIDFPFVSVNQFFRILGCVNGLVCLIDDIGRRTDHVILWNPVIRRSLTLPNPNIALDYSVHRTVVYGFGYGGFSNDYKIVRFLSPRRNSRGKPLVEIFRLSRGFWENLDWSGSLPFLDSRQAYVSGAIHWLAEGNLIMAFDVDPEVLREVKLPNALQNLPFECLIVAAWCKLLSVFESQYPGDFCLWVMEDCGMERTWTRRFVVKSFGIPRWIRSLRKNGEVILVENDNRLVSFDPKTNQVRYSGDQVQGSLRAFHMKSYMESLVLLDRVDGVTILQTN